MCAIKLVIAVLSAAEFIVDNEHYKTAKSSNKRKGIEDTRIYAEMLIFVTL